MKAQRANFGVALLAKLVATLFAVFALVGCAEFDDSESDSYETSEVLHPDGTVTSSLALKPLFRGSKGDKTPPSHGKICKPNCRKKMCGDDGCGGTCGTCSGSDVCESGRCVACQDTAPSSCDDGDACTADIVTAGSCGSVCDHVSITQCVGGDGCCPGGCDANTDADCSSTCGNGVMEPGETCDPSSNCPAFCDDGNACTQDTLQGSPQTCDSSCSYAPVVACTSGDGCCPSGCTTALDSDCAAVCGNGVLEAGETCDPAGSCPTSCNDGGACTVGTLLGSASTCTAECSYAAVETCQDGDGCCPVGCTSANDNDCSAIDCRNASSWPAEWVAFEDEVLALVNGHRAAGTDCPTSVKNPMSPLSTNAPLQEAARCHSVDMAVNSFFGHLGSDGTGLSARLDTAGYVRTIAGENIAAGFSGASGVVAAWMSSPGHCANIMNPGYTETGVGYFYDAASPYGRYWTETFGSP